MAHVVLATIGSLGDLHPFIAIGQALLRQGHRVTLAVPEDALPKTRAAGLAAAAILPSYASICARLGMDEATVAARVMAEPRFVLEQIILASLAQSTAALDALAADADVLAGSLFALAGGIVAEKRALPLALVMLQPMSLFSTWQPPLAPGFGVMRHHPQSAPGRCWNGVFYTLARQALRWRHAAGIDAVRAIHGLGALRQAPLLQLPPASRLMLCCWSRAFGALPPDAPRNALLCGFPFFDSGTGGDEALPSEVSRFLSDGPPPLVFTLGSFVVGAAEGFYEEAARASRMVGRRAILLTGKAGAPCRDGDCLWAGYLPHSAVFPQAAAVIHHGGVGTSGQALRAGCPQIVVPHFGDQFDNAQRLCAAGVALTVLPRQFKAAQVAKGLSRLLSQAEFGHAAHRARRLIEQEDGAGEAARKIAALAR